MSLFLALLPIYLFANLHCIGMCGPLVMMLGRHRFRYYYFLGRLSSFSLAGLFSGWMGSLFHVHFQQFHISAILCLLIGTGLLILGFTLLFQSKIPIPSIPLIKNFSQKMAMLSLQDTPFPIFLFGFSTIFLPCGQTVIVFSALALEADPFFGLINGFLFALLTTPALFFALRASTFLNRFKKQQSSILAISAIIIGLLAFCRGAAEFKMIPHLTFYLPFFEAIHFSLF